MTMILKNISYLMTQNKNRDILQDVDVQIVDDEIVAIGQGFQGDEVIDCSRKLVLPGLINTHTHMELASRRGISDNKPLFEWLKDLNIRNLSGDWKRYAVSVSLIELLRTGTTCVNDCYNTDLATVEKVRSSGIRAILSSYLRDDGEKSENTICKQLTSAVKFHDAMFDKSRITPALGPHSVYNCSSEFLQQIAETASQLNTKVHIHLAETETERAECIASHGRTPVKHLEETGVLSQDTVVAHCIYVDEEDIKLLKENDVSISYCPISNMKLGSGTFPYPEITNNELNIGIGTDGAASNNNLNMFEEAKVASLLQKQTDPAAATAQQIIDCLTITGANAIGKGNRIGSVEINKKADLIIIDLNDTTLIPYDPERLVSHLVFSFNGPVEHSIIDGEFVVRNGEVTGLDRREAIEGLKRCLQN